ncbi:M56 family metallopeptidase [Mucilaginibacter puniceus]
MNWWHYLLLVNFYLVLFFGFYTLLLRKETFFQLNRIYLVVAAVLSFAIPLIQADWVKNLFITQQVQQTIYNTPISTYTYNFTYNITPADDLLTIGEALGILYIVVALILVLKLMWELIVLKKEIEKPDPSVAYSFFKKISLGNNTDNHDVIARHEHVHASQWHTIDVLIIESIVIINWFNPVVYLYRFAIKYVHEFIADNQVLQTGTTDKADYAMLLLTQTFDVPSNHLVSNFYNHSLLKQRIIMLQKNKSKRIALAKYGLSAPLFVLMLILSSATVNNSKALENITTKAEDVLLVPASSSVAMLTNDEKSDLVNSADKIKPTQQHLFADESDVLPIYEVQSTFRDTSKDDRIFTVLEIQPKFPGGTQNFLQYMAANIRYPADDRKNNVTGRVVLQFVVEKDGSLTNIKVVRSPSAAMGQEAVRVLSNSPKWEPGKQGGSAVRAQFTIPVNFTLDKKIDDDYSKVQYNKIYDAVDIMPYPKGGTKTFLEYLKQNLKYPEADKNNKVEGRVTTQLVVEADGRLTNIKVLKSPTTSMANEAVRVLKNAPKWNPAIQKGRKIRLQYTVPINFSLSNDDPSNFIRGLRVDANSPLIIVDGIEVTSDLNRVDASSVQSFSILRDATAVSKYGEKAKNGVIIITTKNGTGPKGETPPTN